MYSLLKKEKGENNVVWTSNSTLFSTLTPNTTAPPIHTADGSQMQVSQYGQVSTSTLTLPNTFLIPKLTFNLISMGQLCELGLELIFSTRGCHVQDPQTGQILGIGRKVGCLFELTSLHIPSSYISQLCAVSTSSSLHLWRLRLGHASIRSPNELSNDQTSAIPVSEDVSSTDIAPGTNEIENPPVTSSSSHPTWVRNPPTYLQDYHSFSALTSLHEPQSYKEASLDPLWQQAMKEELQALEKTGTWDLVDLPIDKTLVGCKWVYKIKTCSDGSMERYKAHLVAKGFTQEYGIDYEETFAPIARLTTVHSLLAIVAVRKWKLFQMDVKNAFLNGDLEEEVYMKPPLGLTPPSNKGMVLLLIYVDDMIITGDDVSRIDEVKQFLNHRFEMKDLGSLSYFLGLEVTSLDDGYLLSQMKYASDLISKTGLTNSKNVSTPLEPNVKLTPLDGFPLLDPTPYRQLVGSLVYLTTTRPDIAYAVHVVSQFMAAPRFIHSAAVLRIICYVKGTLFHGLHFSAHSSLVLHAYSNADWAGDLTDRRSTIGYCLFLGNSLISSRSKKQAIPSRSSTETEYRPLGTVHLVFIGSADQPVDLFTKAHFPGCFRSFLSKLKLAAQLSVAPLQLSDSTGYNGYEMDESDREFERYPDAQASTILAVRLIIRNQVRACLLSLPCIYLSGKRWVYSALRCDDRNLLQALLRRAAVGSRILVTTRDYGVAAGMMNQEAFIGWGEEECGSLKDIGWKTAEKSKGLPLAAKTLRCLLRFKRTREEWENILYSDMGTGFGTGNILLLIGKSIRILNLRQKLASSMLS
ncbi:hypothetical protein SLEP1_g45230 [Rubroshorea leprosula]|uniref:Retrovirus-related Pol polyprotein from transposon RE1 n=1 Tax=Rubroshorea leprosula TaxID=152421 RepID=A0AAV5LIK5_9ROSI|nr:hypothetical protein SLEP1_g45230 [Rubroshorea leprosula]